MYNLSSSSEIVLVPSASRQFMMRIVYLRSSGTPTPRQSELSSLMVIRPVLSLSYCLKMLSMPVSRFMVGGTFCKIPDFKRYIQFLITVLSDAVSSGFSRTI